MSEYLNNPSIILKRRTPTPSIEVNSDEISGIYSSGAWEALVEKYAAKWISSNNFIDSATVWNWLGPSVSFGRNGYSVFVAQYGLPELFFMDLYKHLSDKLGSVIRLSDYVQPSEREGWRPRIHIQNSNAWIPADVITWSKIVIPN